MSVERRRIVTLILAALVVAAGAIGYAVFGDRLARDAAVTVSEAPATAGPDASPDAGEPAIASLDGASPAEASPDEASPAETTIAAIDAAQAPPEEIAAPPTPQDATFDLVRVEPTGDAVIAGQAPPGATVELLRDGVVHDIVVADASGAFAFVPPPLPPGTHEIALQVRDGDAAPRRSPQSVTVVVAQSMNEAPVVALVAPDAPTRILSRPEPAASEPNPSEQNPSEPEPETEVAAAASEPIEEEAVLAADAPDAAAETEAEEALQQTQVARADAAGPVDDRQGIRVATVEAETGGGLFVSGEGEPNASVRLYLNETFVGRASADYAGLVSFAIRRGVRPGIYRVRLDEVDPRDGSVLSRAEVAFEMPEVLAEAEAPTEPALEASPAPSAPVADVAAAVPEADAPRAEAATDAGGDERLAAAEPPVADAPDREATLTIPEINTALVSRGDSLWRISRRIYGAGVRYTVIFDANQEQIRNPNLIYPGQVFVLPALDGEEAGEEAAREAADATAQ